MNKKIAILIACSALLQGCSFVAGKTPEGGKYYYGSLGQTKRGEVVVKIGENHEAHIIGQTEPDTERAAKLLNLALEAVK